MIYSGLPHTDQDEIHLCFPCVFSGFYIQHSIYYHCQCLKRDILIPVYTLNHNSKCSRAWCKNSFHHWVVPTSKSASKPEDCSRKEDRKAYHCALGPNVQTTAQGYARFQEIFFNPCKSLKRCSCRSTMQNIPIM